MYIFFLFLHRVQDRANGLIEREHPAYKGWPELKHGSCVPNCIDYIFQRQNIKYVCIKLFLNVYFFNYTFVHTDNF